MAEQPLYRLRILEGADAGQEVPLTGGAIALGRSLEGLEVTSEAILFEEVSVSRTHAVLTWSQGENVYRLSNRSPISPAMVNGTPAANATLPPGTRIQLGRLVAEVLAADGIQVKLEVEVEAALPPEGSEYLGLKGSQEELKPAPPAWLRVGSDPAPPPAPAPPQEAPAAKAPSRTRGGSKRRKPGRQGP